MKYKMGISVCQENLGQKFPQVIVRCKKGYYTLHSIIFDNDDYLFVTYFYKLYLRVC